MKIVAVRSAKEKARFAVVDALTSMVLAEAGRRGGTLSKALRRILSRGARNSTPALSVAPSRPTQNEDHMSTEKDTQPETKAYEERYQRCREWLRDNVPFVAEALSHLSRPGESPRQVFERLRGDVARQGPTTPHPQLVAQHAPIDSRPVADQVFEVLAYEQLAGEGPEGAVKRLAQEARKWREVQTAPLRTSPPTDAEGVADALMHAQVEGERSPLETLRRVLDQAKSWRSVKDRADAAAGGFRDQHAATAPACNCANHNRVARAEGRSAFSYCKTCADWPGVTPPAGWQNGFDAGRRLEAERGSGEASCKPIAPWTQEHVQKALESYMAAKDSVAASCAIANVERMYGRTK